MLPLIIFLAGGGAAAFRALKPRCTTCESQFTLNEKCLVCGQNVCGECGVPAAKCEHKGWPISPAGRVCRVHEDQYEEQVGVLRAAIDRSDAVTLFSKNYHGSTPAPQLGKVIETESHANRDDAERQLRILAATHKCDAVTSVQFHRDTAASENYKYTVWKGTGIV